MNYIYGPVKSKRLSSSLGVSITPFKYCPIDCVYCQLKKTTNFTLQRRDFIKPSLILTELEESLKGHSSSVKIDYVTLSGSGEPLLNSRVKEIIKGIRKITKIPIALITNSILLKDKNIRKEILDVDLILPSLDAYTQEVFDRINRPLPTLEIKVKDVIEGLVALRKEFTGNIWIEIMLIKEMNDSLEYAQGFKDIINRINPDKVHLNTPTRPPSEAWVKIPSLQALKKIKSILGEKCEII